MLTMNFNSSFAKKKILHVHVGILLAAVLNLAILVVASGWDDARRANYNRLIQQETTDIRRANEECKLTQAAKEQCDADTARAIAESLKGHAPQRSKLYSSGHLLQCKVPGIGRCFNNHPDHWAKNACSTTNRECKWFICCVCGWKYFKKNLRWRKMKVNGVLRFYLLFSKGKCIKCLAPVDPEIATHGDPDCPVCSGRGTVDVEGDQAIDRACFACKIRSAPPRYHIRIARHLARRVIARVSHRYEQDKLKTEVDRWRNPIVEEIATEFLKALVEIHRLDELRKAVYKRLSMLNYVDLFKSLVWMWEDFLSGRKDNFEDSSYVNAPEMPQQTFTADRLS